MADQPTPTSALAYTPRNLIYLTFQNTHLQIKAKNSDSKRQFLLDEKNIINNRLKMLLHVIHTPFAFYDANIFIILVSGILKFCRCKVTCHFRSLVKKKVLLSTS